MVSYRLSLQYFLQEHSQQLHQNHKLCFHCNAEVDVDVIVCPFCGVDLMHEKHFMEDEYEDSSTTRPLSTQETLASLYIKHLYLSFSQKSSGKNNIEQPCA